MLGTTTTTTKKKMHAHFSEGCFHIASERFMFCNNHEEQKHRSAAVWGLCTPRMNDVDVFLLVWWQTAASAQQIAPRREHRALTSLTPPAAYRWASPGCVGTHIQGTRDQRLGRAQKGDRTGCVHVCVCACFHFPDALTDLLISQEPLPVLTQGWCESTSR